MNVPKLRFKEFTDEWQKKPLKDIVYSNIIEVPKPTTDYIRLGIRSHCKGTFHELVKIENILSADKMYIVPKDNLILNITFAWEQAIAITDKNDEGKYVSNRFPTFAFKNNQLPAFYKYIISQNRLKYDLNVASPGGAGRNRVLNKKLFLLIPINIPSFEEQKKIANFLSTVDKKIANLENIITTLENQKKGLLQQIFNQKLRFKDENGNNYPDWKKKKLGDICKFTGGGTPSTSILKYWNGIIPWISSSDLQTNTIHKINISRYITNEAVSNSSTKIIPKNSILIVSRVGVGKVAISNCVLCTSQDFTNITEINGNTIFYAYLLKYKMEQLTQNTQGTSIKGITTSDIKNIKLIVPTEQSEQTKIADFLSAFDRKIDNQKAQLEHWKQIKKGLLQQMFV